MFAPSSPRLLFTLGLPRPGSPFVPSLVKAAPQLVPVLVSRPDSSSALLVAGLRQVGPLPPAAPFGLVVSCLPLWLAQGPFRLEVLHWLCGLAFGPAAVSRLSLSQKIDFIFAFCVRGLPAVCLGFGLPIVCLQPPRHGRPHCPRCARWPRSPFSLPDLSPPRLLFTLGLPRPGVASRPFFLWSHFGLRLGRLLAFSWGGSGWAKCVHSSWSLLGPFIRFRPPPVGSVAPNSTAGSRWRRRFLHGPAFLASDYTPSLPYHGFLSCLRSPLEGSVAPLCHLLVLR